MYSSSEVSGWPGLYRTERPEALLFLDTPTLTITKAVSIVPPARAAKNFREITMLALHNLFPKSWSRYFQKSVKSRFVFFEITMAGVSELRPNPWASLSEQGQSIDSILNVVSRYSKPTLNDSRMLCFKNFLSWFKVKQTQRGLAG